MSQISKIISNSLQVARSLPSHIFSYTVDALSLQIARSFVGKGFIKHGQNDVEVQPFPNRKRPKATGDVFVELTWYDSSPWADVFINNEFSTLPSLDGRKMSLKEAFPLGGIT